jgi:cardiolipin synthase
MRTRRARLATDPARRPSGLPDAVDPAQYRLTLERLLGTPASDGNQVDILRNGDQIFPAMLEAIRAARTSVDMLTYSWWSGEITHAFARALAERARAGVRVRLMVDALGGRGLDRDMVAGLRNAGVLVHLFRPYTSLKIWNLNLRSHRRVLVCDDEVAFTGGVDEWRDTHFRVRGPAIDGVHAAFLGNWLQTTYPLLDDRDDFPRRQPVGDTPVQTLRATSEVGWNDTALALHGLLRLAQDRVRITSAYFRPPQHFVDLLCSTASRGVTVEVLTPGPHTEPLPARWMSQYYYDELLAGGVQIFNDQRSMLHAKIVTVDGVVAMVGTANVDSRSIALNEQVTLILHDPDLTATLDAHFDDDLTLSERIDPARWARRPLRQRAREHAAHLAAYGIRAAGAAR